MKYPWQLYHWHFEVSGKCTLKCPRCPRNDEEPVFKLNKELDLNFFKKVLSPELLKNEVQRITMCGDIGDPIYASQYLDIVDYIKTHNDRIHLYTITNGSYKKDAWWRDFAKISNEYDTVNFSVDGYDQASNNLYRVNSDWDSIMSGMNIMCQHSKAFVYWATIVFQFNQDHLANIEQQAKSIGCDGLQLTLSTKFGSKYGERYNGDHDELEPRAEWISKSHRYERRLINLSGRQQLNQQFMAETQQRFEQVKNKHNTFITPLCEIGNRAIYVSADGLLHPCSWTSYTYREMGNDRKTIHFKDNFQNKFKDSINLHHRSLEDVLNDDAWSYLFNSFDDQRCAWVECEQKCHKSLVDQDYAVDYLTN